MFEENPPAGRQAGMHHNPVRGKWNLASDFALYPHSSAGYYYGPDAHAYKRIVPMGELAE